MLGFCGGAPAAAEGLEKALNDHYKVATIGVRENGDSMLHPGTILEVRAEGIVSFGEKDASYAELCPSEVRAGAIRTPKNSACNSLAPKSRRLLKPQERVCLTALHVREEADTVSFFVAGVDSPGGRERFGARRALIVFHLPKGWATSGSPAKVEGLIAETLAEPQAHPAAPEVDSAAKPNGDQGSASSADAEPGRTDAGTVSEGQSGEDVEAILGPPTSVDEVDGSIIFIYPKLKVIFSKGRVASIERQ